MELKKTKTSYDFYVGCVHVMRIHRMPKDEDFDSDRTCRMIQRMENLFECCKDMSLEKLCLGDFLSKWSREIKSDIDFIEHGDKQTAKEMLQTLLKYHKEGASQAVMDNYWQDVERICND